MTMHKIELSAGTIEYKDSGGEGPVIVLLHGFLMDASLWDGVIADLAVDHRWVTPTLPLGAYRHAMRADASDDKAERCIRLTFVVVGAGYAFAFANPDNKGNASNAPGQINAQENRLRTRDQTGS
jgi:pimeloyl-ACP methyl ester carboxylesterase